MKQYGDITKLNGAELEPVDLIVGGSPCQDLSIAGKRAGLEGERSGLFMEMVRIIKEMRNATNLIRPRYVLWENVVGAYSSRGGYDFSAVLGEFVRIIEPNAPDVPVPAEGWKNSGILLGSDWSMAWRTHDAQFWGVPQRRRRISLVVDLRGRSAPEILFERKSMPGNPEQGKAERKGTTGTAAESADGTGTTIFGESVTPTLLSRAETATGNTQDGLCDAQTISFQERSGKPGGGTLEAGKVKHVLCLNDHGGNSMDVSTEKCGTLRAASHQHEPLVYDPSVHHDYRELGEVSETVRSRYGTGGNNVPMVVCAPSGETVDCLAGNCIDRADTAECNGCGWTKDVSYTLNTIDRPAVAPVAVSVGNGQMNGITMSETANSLDTMHDQQAVLCCDEGFFSAEEERASKLLARDYKAPKIVNQPKVRRLTPLECERLQGYPDGWTDIPGATDSKRYKALGNSIALPFWEHLAYRFTDIGGVRSIGSLFDGIGGFPLVFKRAGAETLWTSEIDLFPEQVVKYHLEHGEL